MTDHNQLKEAVSNVETFIKDFYANEVAKDFKYHNFSHTLKVVEAAKIISDACDLSEKDSLIVELAAWFHDTGFHQGQQDHEKASIKVMRKELAKHGVAEDDLLKIEGCIKATKLPQNPQSQVEKVMADADLFHLSNKDYFDYWLLMKAEYEATQHKELDEQQCFKDDLSFFKQHEYFTKYGKEELEKLKKVNYKLLKGKMKKVKKKDKKIEALEAKVAKLTEKASHALKPDKARETMLRITSKNHLELSSMADSKANIMISINSIILSIVLSLLLRRLEESPYLIIPTIILTVVCLVTIVFAILSTRPNISKGKFNQQDVIDKKTNLLFFGNFHGMEMKDYMWAMQSMLKDPDYLYSSMIKDIYFLGVILGKKYRLLRKAYTFFMFGINIAILSFILAYVFRGA